MAVDGISAAGKSTLAAELQAAFVRRSRHAVLVSLDGFHHPRSRRYRRGRRSPVGYYEDAFDLDSIVERVLLPLGPGGSRRYVTRTHDLLTDETVTDPPQEAPPDAVILVDGSFLQRPELLPHWDVRIFVDTSPEVAAARSARRDADLLGGERRAAELFAVRYAPAFELYLERADPVGSADVVVVNDDPSRPELRWRGSSAVGRR